MSVCIKHGKYDKFVQLKRRIYKYSPENVNVLMNFIIMYLMSVFRE